MGRRTGNDLYLPHWSPGHDDEDTSRCSTGACFVVGIGEISQHLLVKVTGDSGEERRIVREPYLLGIIVLILFESEKH